VLEVRFRRCCGDAKGGGSLGQRAPGEKAGEHTGFGPRQAEGGSNSVCTVLLIRWRANENSGNGRGCGAGSGSDFRLRQQLRRNSQDRRSRYDLPDQ
jgi:hypothetical protein